MNKLKDNKERGKQVKQYVIVGASLALLSLACAESAYAKFDIDAGVAAATNPLIDGIKAHWGKGVMLSGGGAALFGEGDGRQRAIRAAIAAGSAGAVILGMIALLT